jgi:hypothetical protein
MDPTHDSLDRVHDHQAARRGLDPLPHAESCRRLRGLSDTDLAGLLQPPPGAKGEIRVKRQAKLDPGRLCITPNAATTLPPEEVLQAIARHAVADWGMLDPSDRQQNERALRQGGRLVSVYLARSGQRFYVITESGHEVTTVLLPEDY